MQRFFQFHPKLHAFHLFSMEHLLTIGMIMLLCFLLFALKRQWMKSNIETFFRFSLAYLLLIAVLSQHFWLVYENAWSVKNDLPLQLSDLVVIIGILMLFTKSDKLFQFMYFSALGSSLQAILTPDLGRFSFPHFRYIEFFISHGGVVIACLFMVIAFNYRPTIRSMWVTILLINLYAACIFFLNKLLGSNYLYLMKKPKNASLLDYFGSWPLYLLSMELMMIVSFYILYSPFWIKRKTQI